MSIGKSIPHGKWKAIIFGIPIFLIGVFKNPEIDCALAKK